MSDKATPIKYWQSTAEDDIGAIEVLLKGKKYVQTLFFTHLALEKILKAHWVKHNEGNVPPRTHNLIVLYENSGLDLP